MSGTVCEILRVRQANMRSDHRPSKKLLPRKFLSIAYSTYYSFCVVCFLFFVLQKTPRSQYNIIALPETRDAYYSLVDSPDVLLLGDDIVWTPFDAQSLAHRLVWHATRVVHMLPGSFHVLGIFFVGIPWHHVGTAQYRDYVYIMDILNKYIYIYI